MNLSKATNEQLSKLVVACAADGRDHTVLRKPIQLDPSHFSMPFDLTNTDILHKIQQDLVETDIALRQRIRVNLSKLDVYGERHYAFLYHAMELTEVCVFRCRGMSKNVPRHARATRKRRVWVPRCRFPHAT